MKETTKQEFNYAIRIMFDDEVSMENGELLL